jgi:hypothetical protein
MCETWLLFVHVGASLTFDVGFVVKDIRGDVDAYGIRSAVVGFFRTTFSSNYDVRHRHCNKKRVDLFDVRKY